MSLWQQVRSLILNRNYRDSQVNFPIVESPKSPVSGLLYFVARHFYIFAATATAFYILIPSFPYLRSNKKMFTKRPDKHTTGLINLRNDCFANSTLQAYLSLPGLTEYLNQFISEFEKLAQLMIKHNIAEDLKVDTSEGTKSRDKNSKFEIPLHIALAEIVKKLQETQMTTRTISVWTFLHSLEKIFDARISRSQHDAHELTLLINETLENENVKIVKNYRLWCSKFQDNVHAIDELESIDIPEFPFSGLILSQMRCLTCSHVSKPSFSPFLMLTLHTPQKVSTNLESMLEENDSESIEGYQCIKCRVSKIVENEMHRQAQGKSVSPDEADFINKLKELDSDPQLSINRDLESSLEDYVKSYKKDGVDISQVSSTVLRKALILKPPKVFGIHLSRSSFNGVEVTRNPCRVTFNDSLSLSIGQEYYHELKQFQSAAQEEGSTGGQQIKSNVLTTDVNDMEDEDVQREDFEENGNDEDDEEESAGISTASELDTSDTSSLTSAESVNSLQQSTTTAATLRENTNIKFAPSKTSGGSPESSAFKSPDTLNNTPITEDQTDNLKRHFQNFKFNENDNYKYKLKAMIRHQGSHTQGHYECYKHKPLFVKDREGNIIKLSPEIKYSPMESADVQSSLSTGDMKSKELNTLAEPEKKRKFTLTGNRRPSIAPSDEISNNKPRTYSESSNASSATSGSDQEFSNGGFRRKLSNFMGKRPSVYQAHTEEANIQEIITSGLTTPAEILVNDIDSGYFNAPVNSQALMKTLEEQQQLDESTKESHKVKMKKIPTLIKSPYWRISDATITEVSRSAVLLETTTVYMLYYERVDRKQIRQRS